MLGTLQAASYASATNGDTALVLLVASIVGQQGEQEGWYRIVQGKRPSASPFLTASAGPFTFTALRSFVVPGSCPNSISTDITTLQPLTVTTPRPAPVNGTLAFAVVGAPSLDGLYVAYVSGQNVAVVEPITDVEAVAAKNVTTFKALFSFQTGAAMFSAGLTIGAVTVGKGPFANASAVADNAVYGPGLIEIG